jgi:hypothetical protein
MDTAGKANGWRFRLAGAGIDDDDADKSKTTGFGSMREHPSVAMSNPEVLSLIRFYGC